MTANAARCIIALLLIWLAIAAIAVGGLVQSQDARVLDSLPGVYRAHLRDHGVNDQVIARLRQVPALRSFWARHEGEDYGYFDWPDDHQDAGWMYIWCTDAIHDQSDGAIEWATSATTPEVVYVRVYNCGNTLEWVCDANGEHCGTHPLGGAWVADKQAWLDALRAGE